MGIKLIVEVLDHAPRDLTPVERLVLVVIAETANDSTREAWPGLDLIARRTGLHPDTLRRIFLRWVHRVPPIDVRRVIGKGADGRMVYSARGRRTTYILPRFAPNGVTEHPAIGGERRDADDAKGVTLRRERRDAASRPSLKEPSKNPQSSRAPSKASKMLASHGATEDESQIIINKIQEQRAPDNMTAYIATLAESGDLAEMIDEVRDYARKTAMHHAYRTGWRCRRCASANRSEASQCRQCQVPREAS